MSHPWQESLPTSASTSGPRDLRVYSRYTLVVLCSFGSSVHCALRWCTTRTHLRLQMFVLDSCASHSARLDAGWSTRRRPFEQHTKSVRVHSGVRKAMVRERFCCDPPMQGGWTGQFLVSVSSGDRVYVIVHLTKRFRPEVLTWTQKRVTSRNVPDHPCSAPSHKTRTI